MVVFESAEEGTRFYILIKNLTDKLYMLGIFERDVHLSCFHPSKNESALDPATPLLVLLTTIFLKCSTYRFKVMKSVQKHELKLSAQIHIKSKFTV